MSIEIIHKIIKLFEVKIGLNSHNMTLHTWNSLINQRIKALCLNSVNEYYQKLMSSSKEFEELLELVLVPETWFFRDKNSLEFLTYSVNHHWLRQEQRSKQLKILSVPCSTGEEPYSIAIILHKIGLPEDLFTIDAWDISKRGLEKAEVGIYTTRSFRDKQAYQNNEDYFEYKEGFYKVKPFLQRRIRFQNINLLDPHFAEKYADYDYIFCKNLLIYLTSQAQTVVLEKFKKLLKKEGLLIVGPAEMELVRNFGMQAVSSKQFCAFKKKESQSIDASFIPKSSSVKPLGQFFLSQFKVPDLEITPQHAMQQAVDLADRGDFEKAKNLCEKILRQDSANAEAIFLMGVLQHATGNLDSAEAAFKKTIYLEPNHYDALIYLALLAERKEAFEEAQLFRNRAMRVIVN